MRAEDLGDLVLARLAGEEIHFGMQAHTTAKRQHLAVEISAVLSGEIWNAVIVPNPIKAMAWRAFHPQARRRIELRPHGQRTRQQGGE
jgi:hypothetical protein